MQLIAFRDSHLPNCTYQHYERSEASDACSVSNQCRSRCAVLMCSQEIELITLYLLMAHSYSYLEMKELDG
jgi:hypothetical protein